MRVTYKNGEIRDEHGTQLLRIVASNTTNRFRDRCGKTLARIINAEERGKELAPDPATVERVAVYLAAQHSPDIADAVRVRFSLERARSPESTNG